MVDSEDRYNIPHIGEIVRRLDSMNRRLDEIERTTERRHQENLALTQTMSKELTAMTQAAYRDFQAQLNALDKRITVSETTQKMTVAIISIAVSIFSTGFIQIMLQLFTHH